MGGGCLFESLRWIGGGFLRLGGWVAGLFIRTFVFLFMSVIAPFGLGATRETVRRVIGVGDEDRAPAPRGWAAYALLSGLLWVVGYLLMLFLWGLLSRGTGVVGRWLPTWLGFLAPLLVLGAIFAVGAVIGVWIFRHNEDFFTGW
jgi:hypothetical protein